jgi:7-keto-8-aminopelargonate synthetase-like enzyme
VTEVVGEMCVFASMGWLSAAGRCDLADKYDAMVMVDECHAADFIGATGKGT